MYTNPFSSDESGQPSCSHPFLSSPTGISPWWVKHCTAYDPGCSNKDFKERPKFQGSKLPFFCPMSSPPNAAPVAAAAAIPKPPPKHLCFSCWRSRPSNGGPPAICFAVAAAGLYCCCSWPTMPKSSVDPKKSPFHQKEQSKPSLLIQNLFLIPMRPSTPDGVRLPATSKE